MKIPIHLFFAFCTIPLISQNIGKLEYLSYSCDGVSIFDLKGSNKSINIPFNTNKMIVDSILKSVEYKNNRMIESINGYHITNHHFDENDKFTYFSDIWSFDIEHKDMLLDYEQLLEYAKKNYVLIDNDYKTTESNNTITVTHKFKSNCNDNYITVYDLVKEYNGDKGRYTVTIRKSIEDFPKTKTKAKTKKKK